MAAREIVVLGNDTKSQELPGEIWKDIPGFDGYQASNMGRVRSLHRKILCPDRWGIPGWRNYRGRILSPGTGKKKGYPHVQLGKGNYDYSGEDVHKLVALAFLGPRPSIHHEVAHWDGNRKNNTLSNLRYATYEEQHQDQVRHGRASRGSKHTGAKLSEADVMEIRLSKETTCDLARKYNVSTTTIFQVRNKLTWRWLNGDDTPGVIRPTNKRHHRDEGGGQNPNRTVAFPAYHY